MTRSYYGRPVLKTPVWEWKIPAYLFAGGLSAGSALLGAGADLTGRPALRRAGRLSALANLGVSTYLLVADLGRPERFHHMLRVAKPTSPMSVGTWVLMSYSPGTGLAAAAELLPSLSPSGWSRPLAPLVKRWPWLLSPKWRLVARVAGLSSAAAAPAVASYTAVLLSQTAVPAWHEAFRQLPFVFTGSAAASAGGMGMMFAPVGEAGPARALGATGAAVEMVSARLVDHRLGLVGENYRTGRAHQLRKWSEALTAAGLAGSVLARRSRVAGIAAGLALLGGSVLQRFGVFEAGIASAEDPKYVVEPQRQRVEDRAAVPRVSPPSR
jgi:polysulfide reductase-like protein